MSLSRAVRAAFADESLLRSAAIPYRPREGQLAMADAVAESIECGGVLVVEAGTGVGKTFAYLVPALLSGERVLVSTATKTLQDQLFGRDLPLLARALGIPARAALLKGRASYLCWHRLEQAHQAPQVGEPGVAHTLSRIQRWSGVTVSGDLAELPGLDERSPVLPLVTSTRENCLGSNCPRFRDCHVQRARREAMAADIVVVNHHLFFADMAVRESGMAELLPTVRVVIFDEAHQLNNTGVQFLGRHLGTARLIDGARDLLAAGLRLARGLQDWSALAAGIERAARDLRLQAGRRSAVSTRLRWVDAAPEGLDPAAWADALAAVAAACDAARDALARVAELGPDLDRLQERMLELGNLCRSFGEPAPADAVRWVEVGHGLRLIESPLDVAEALRAQRPGAQADPADRRAWIFTSATLGDDERLSWFTEPCGLDDARVLRVASPFDYEGQSAVYVPDWAREPGSEGHSQRVADFVLDAARGLGGRTLVLTTTLRALRAIAEALRTGLGEADRLEVLEQGQRTKRELLERFRLLGSDESGDGQGGAILVASASFWEGVDLPGDLLQLVVIDKLPFPPPNDPLAEARARRLEAQGRSAFNHYFVPEAAVALKQGAGRLIRSESDQGLLVVCDARLRRMGYGRRLMAALPPMRRIEGEAAWAEALQRLTRTSTRACPGP